LSRIELSQGAWIDLDPGWLSERDAARLLAVLTTELVWEQRHIVLFGKPILQPRLIAWAGDLPYRYSGQTLEPRFWPPALGAELGALSDRIGDAAGASFNHVLVNRYRDGKDSMGYHADAEPELGPDPVVATLSLGATRRFLIRPHPARPSERPLSLPLGAGSLLVMGGTCQRHYRHAIARENTAPVGERVSLTFRCLIRAPASSVL
jgi:alkylated DNA repair dioxygenase AlkB